MMKGRSKEDVISAVHLRLRDGKRVRNAMNEKENSGNT